MSAHAFNPLKAARAFREAGADENLAEAMAGAIGDAAEKVEENLVTKADLHAFEQRLTGGMEALDQRTTSAMKALEQHLTGGMEALEQRTTSAMEALEQHSTGGMEALEQRTTSAMEALEQRMRATMFRALWLQTGAIIAAVTAVTKLVP